MLQVKCLGDSASQSMHFMHSLSFSFLCWRYEVNLTFFQYGHLLPQWAICPPIIPPSTTAGLALLTSIATAVGLPLFPFHTGPIAVVHCNANFNLSCPIIPQLFNRCKELNNFGQAASYALHWYFCRDSTTKPKLNFFHSCFRVANTFSAGNTLCSTSIFLLVYSLLTPIILQI